MAIPHGPPKRIRASIGTLAKLGILRLRLSVESATAYLLTDGGCLGRCAFCPQWSDRDRLSHLKWPLVELDVVVRGQHSFKRICVQSTLKRGFWAEVLEVASMFEVPVSISLNPVNKGLLRRLARWSERIGVGLDAMSPRIFRIVNKPGTWDSYMRFVRNAIEIYGERKVHVHLIAGMGESVEESVRIMKALYDMGGEVALFSFTPVNGTPMESHSPPKVEYYRALQIVRYFLSEDIPLNEIFKMDPDDFKEAFLTSGCPSCNRPFYNERPRGPIYNFPSKDLLDRVWEITRKEVERSLEYIRFLSQG